MDPVHDRGSIDPVHESGPWTWSKVGVHGPLVHVLSSPQLYRHQRTQRTWKTFTALSGNRFWTRHVLLSGPKLRNTNCTDMFSIGSISAVSRVRSLILPEVGGCVRAHFPEKRLVIEPMFSTAVTRHKQQTSGRLRMANNTIVKCFFKFMSLVRVSFH